jgi:simple sugar transport system permease protein
MTSPSRFRRCQGLTVHLGLFFGLAAAAVLWLPAGARQMGATRSASSRQPAAARYAGINIGRSINVVFAVSGGLAGLAGMSEWTGVIHRLTDHISPGYGYTAIIIAYLRDSGPSGSWSRRSCSGR